MVSFASALGTFVMQDIADGMGWHRDVGGAGVTPKEAPVPPP